MKESLEVYFIAENGNLPLIIDDVSSSDYELYITATLKYDKLEPTHANSMLIIYKGMKTIKYLPEIRYLINGDIVNVNTTISLWKNYERRKVLKVADFIFAAIMNGYALDMIGRFFFKAEEEPIMTEQLEYCGMFPDEDNFIWQEWMLEK